MITSKLFISTLCFCVFSINLNAETVQFFGTATDLKTGKFLYTDNHKENWVNGKHVSSDIEYKNSSGKAFAKKTISFAKNSELAEFKLEDFRDGYIEGAKINGKEVTLFFKKNSSEELQEKTFPIPTNAVADGGFDYFVRNNWDYLDKGNKKTFQMFAPSQQDNFKFLVKKINRKEFNDEDYLNLKLELDSIIGVFLPSINLTYSRKTRRIANYEGISNINNEKGKSYFVKLIYDQFK
ncbi:MAG: hypothetical protein SFU98_15780 [Leptospiraceae bacterium]|nr:hypothetical protein [Leptospiraceae bacterium]